MKIDKNINLKMYSLMIFKIFFFLQRNEDCDCWLYKFGCRINPFHPPPKGYKCNCRYHFFTCTASLVPCNDDPDSKACSGCADKECCSNEGWNGDCTYYEL